MEWCVAKTGMTTFDALHTYGLGILLAVVAGSPIKLADEGIVYRLHGQMKVLPKATPAILDQVLALPSLKDIQADTKHPCSVDTEIANLDGLLAALFTTPGVRLGSVDRVRYRQQYTPSASQDSLAKAHAAIKRWKQFSMRRSPRNHAWLKDLLKDYDPDIPVVPVWRNAKSNSICVLMTIEPALSFSTHQQISDGLVTDKSNVMVEGTPYASILAFLGAARFLRAQHIAGNSVMLYVPLAVSLTLRPDTAMQTLPSVDLSPDHALVRRWLTLFRKPELPGTAWNSLAYQVMQTQGAQQSISVDRGCLDYSWLSAVQHQAGRALIGYWQSLLGNYGRRDKFDADSLVDFLLRRHGEDWVSHLRELAALAHRCRDSKIPQYSLKGVTMNTSGSTVVPLHAVLRREEGTLRFGHSLRLLGQYNGGRLREILDDLDTVQTRDDLVRILARAAQECAVTRAKSEFIIVPNDEDLIFLLDDVDMYGARTIAGLLIILSALHYPRTDNTTSEQPTA